MFSGSTLEDGEASDCVCEKRPASATIRRFGGSKQRDIPFL
jgi:hypothetical protein